MRQTTFATLTHQGMADAFNLVYTGYFVPVAIGARDAHALMQAGDIALDASPLLLDDTGAVVAFAALGVRGTRGWVGGFGVAPANRGRGISHQLIGALLDCAQRMGVHTVALEVLVQNVSAIRTYLHAGFVQHRDLRTFRCEQPDATEDGSDITQADPAVLLPHRAQIGAPPPWQREPASVEKVPGMVGLVYGRPEAPQAFLLSRTSDDAVTIVDMAAPDTETTIRLVGALARRSPGRPMRLTNEPAESPVCVALASLGWEEIHRQHEMYYVVPPPD